MIIGLVRNRVLTPYCLVGGTDKEGEQNNEIAVTYTRIYEYK